MQHGWFPHKIHSKNLHVIFTQTLYLYPAVLHANLRVFLRWLILLVKIQASCVYFFTTANMAGVKLEADIVKNVFSLWKKRNNLLYINFIVVNFPLLRMSCFVNQCKFLGCWLKRDFKLHDTVSHVNLDACYSTGKGHCSIMRVFLYNSKYGWCKIRSRHCEKCLFTVEKKKQLTIY